MSEIILNISSRSMKYWQINDEAKYLSANVKMKLHCINYCISIPLIAFLISLFKFFGSLSNLSYLWFLFWRALLNVLLKPFTSLLLYGKLESKNSGITLDFLQFNKKFMSKSALLTLIDHFSNFLSLLIGSTPPWLFKMS